MNSSFTQLKLQISRSEEFRFGGNSIFRAFCMSQVLFPFELESEQLNGNLATKQLQKLPFVRFRKVG